jgi:MFS family permease
MPPKNDPGADTDPAEKGTLSEATIASAGRGLDWLNLFVANVQTGFGAFIAVYLTTRGWTQTAIGLALSVGTVTAMASQLPAGALVDVVRNKSAVALVSILAFSASALLFALRPIPLLVYLAEILHGFSSCTLGPAIAAMSLVIAGAATLGPRLGRNARFASIGNGIGAALMGACGYYLSARSVFFLTALLALPALVPLIPLSRLRHAAHPARSRAEAREATSVRLRHVATDRRLLIFAGCALLFTLGNAAMLPLASVALTRGAGETATLLIAACIVLPQIIVAVLSPGIGQLAETHGRRAALLIGFCTLPIRGVLFAVIHDPYLIVLVQILDGVAGACIGVLVPLVTADITGRTGYFNLSLGFVGLAIGIGATISTTAAGWIADRLGAPAAFASLAGIGLAALLLVWGGMPETHPRPERP